jgi:hypothetical protein
MQPAVTECLLWVKMYPLGPSSLYPMTTLPSSSLSPKRSLLRQDDEEILGTRAERYDLCAICRKSVFNRRFESAEAQDFPVLIAHETFSSTPVLEVTSLGIPRSRRQWAGL